MEPEKEERLKRGERMTDLEEIEYIIIRLNETGSFEYSRSHYCEGEITETSGNPTER